MSIPRWTRWPLAYLALLGASALVGWLTVGVGSAVFAAGIGCIFVSLWFIRLGGPRSVVTLRAPDGKPLRREPMPEADREREIRLGVGILVLGLGLWGAAIAGYALL